jgi:hypothetical protein
MGLSLMNMFGLSSRVYFAHTTCYWKLYLLYYTQVLCHCRIYRTDHASLTYLMLQWQLSHLNDYCVILRLRISQSVSLGIEHPPGAHDQIFIAPRLIRSCFCGGALSDERMGLSFVYAAGPFQRSVSRVLVPWDDGDIRPRLHTGSTQTVFFVLSIIFRHGPHRKHRSIVAWISLRGNVFAQLFHSNGCTRHISYRDNSSIIACGHYLATAVFLVHFLLWANTPQY